jgi:hypothetical protein
MNSSKNILLSIVFFGIVLFCFESKLLAHFHSPLYNIEHSSGSKGAEDNQNSNKDYFEESEIQPSNFISFKNEDKYHTSRNTIFYPNYTVAIWQPPK